jgi:macrolide-specific efflux system membrane fusion protein
MKSVLANALRHVRSRPWTSAAVGAVVVAGALVAYLVPGGSSNAAPPGITTRLVAASEGTVRQTVSTSGTFAPADEKDLSFSSSAEVTSVRVAVGDRVKSGQVLGTIDTVSLSAALAEAKSTLAQAKATLTDDEDSGTATDDELTADRASVSTAHAAVTSAREALDGATLRSPISGTVAEVNVAKGDVTTGSSSSGNGSGSGAGGSGAGGGSNGGGSGSSGNSGGSGSSGSGGGTSADFVVIGGKAWTVSASVDDTEVGLIKKGDQVQLTTANVTNTIFGTVSSVAVLASTSSGSASYAVTIAVTGNPAGLHDGASATASIIYRQATNVLTVPSAAVHADSGSSYVYVAVNGTKRKQTVHTGLTGGGTTQITSGLSAGQQVYVETLAPTTRTGSTSGGIGNRGEFPGAGTGRFPGGGQFPAGGQFPGGFGGGNLKSIIGSGGGK